MKKKQPKFPRTWAEFLKVLRQAGRNWHDLGGGDIRCERGDCPAVAVVRFLYPELAEIIRLDPALAIEELEGREPSVRVRELVSHIIDAADYVVSDVATPAEKRRRRQMEAATVKRIPRLTFEEV